MVGVEIKTVWIVLITAVVAATFYPIFLGKYYVVGDTRDVFIPLELFFQKEIRTGHLPVWMPEAAWGFPVIAAGQIGFFYPPLFLSRLILPVWIYFPLMLIGHVIAMGIGMYLFARALKFSSAASYLAAVAFTLGQFVIQHTTHLNFIMAIVWFPWQMFWAQRVAVKKKLSWRDLTGFVLLLGIPFLAGQLQMQLLMAGVAVVWFGYLRLAPLPKTLILTFSLFREKGLHLLGIILLLALGTIALASAQLLPTLELVQQSSRGGGGDFDIVRANQYSFPLYHLPTLLFPRFFDNDFNYWGKRLEIEYGIFIGTIPFLLTVYGLQVTGYRLRFFKLLLIVSFLLALGAFSPFRLLGLEPTLWIFSGPARWLLFTTFSGAVLAAAGWERVVKKFPWRLVIITGMVVGLATAVTTFLLFSTDISTLGSNSTAMQKLAQMQVSAQTSSMSLVSWYTWLPLVTLIAWPLVWHRRWGQEITLAIIMAELIIIAATTTPAIFWRQVLAPPDTIALLPDNVKAGEARIFSVRQGGDTGAHFTNPTTRADAAKREEQRRLLVPLIHTQFGLGGVEWPASLDLQAATVALEKLRGSDGYEVQNKEVAAELNIGAVIAARDNGMSVQVLPTKPRLEIADGKAISLERTGDKEKIQVDSVKVGQLIIRDTWYPGWEAFIDSQLALIEKVNDIFRGVTVPAGKHIVEIRYKPMKLMVGMAISGFTLVLCLLGLYKKNNL